MKKHSYFLPVSVLCALFFVSCSVEELDETNFELEQTLSSKSQSDSKKGNSKVEICHYNEGTNSFNRISVSVNGLNGHKNHKNDILVFDEDGDGYPAENECGINFREDGLWDLDDNDDTIQDELDCFSHIVGHYYASKYHGSSLFELDFIVSKEDDNYFINGSLTETKQDGTIKEKDVILNIHSVNELYTKFYSFKYSSGNSSIEPGFGNYDCGTITVSINISGSGIPGQAFNAVRTK